MSWLNLRIVVVCMSLWFVVKAASAQSTLPASFVDPLIGTAPNPLVKVGWAFDTGNVFPGAVCPRGMLAWSPDTTNHTHIAGGYWYPDNKIEDFSLTHFSGRGVVCLKDIAFMPFTQAATASPGTHWTDYSATYSHEKETASPGFYRVILDSGIETELAAAPRSGIARFFFPRGVLSTLLLRANGSITVNGSQATGYAENRVGKGGAYRVYFVVEFNRPPISVKTWTKDTISDTSVAQDPSCGAILYFADVIDPLQARVGISYTSLDNAKENLAKEITSWNLDAVHRSAVDSWNKALGQIELKGGTPDQLKTFYTALYHCYMHPNILDDENGQYIGSDDKVHKVDAGHHQYQNIPAWDEHRSHSPLVAMLAPDQASDVVQSLVNFAQQDRTVRPEGGGLPRWEQVNRNSGGMAGDGDDTIIATSYAFGAKEFDTKAAWEAMDRGASQPDVTSDGRKVRGGLTDYASKGYVPDAAAITLEYCTDDFSLSQYASSLGDAQASAKYLKRAQNWKNLFDAESGYIRPKSADGKFLDPFTPRSGKGFIEGSAAQYFWMVNFNFRGLIDAMGGNAKAVSRLDEFFTKVNDGMSSRYAYMGNEPDEETPWVYDYAGAPAKAQDVVRRIQNECFTAKPNGIPGNDDAGSLSSWYVFSALGIYPEVPGVAGFVTGSPMFSDAVIHLQNGKTIEIVGDHASPTSRYVQSASLNGKPLNGPWIEWSALANGGSIAFNLSDKASQWGSDPANAPPSFGSEPHP